MSSDPAGAIQKAVYAALRAALAGAPVAGRIYDRVPPAPTHPYVAFGPAQTLEDGDDCIDGSESFLDLHVWSEEVGFTQAKAIADTIRSTLDRADLTLDGHALVEMQVTQTRYLRDPDGLTSHAVVELRVLSEAAA